jgi:hypothetical protein
MRSGRRLDPEQPDALLARGPHPISEWHDAGQLRLPSSPVRAVRPHLNVCLLISCKIYSLTENDNMDYKFHRVVPDAAKVSALPIKVACFVGGHRHLGRMTLCNQDVYMQVWNHETVCTLVGGDYQFNRFSFLERDLCRSEGKVLGVNLNSVSRFLCSGNRLDEDRTYE